MASTSKNDDDGNDTVFSNSPTEEETTTTTKKQHFNNSSSSSTTETLTSRPSSSSAIPQDDLPFEIILQILSRLPVKFLMQFQSVSKPWKSLISDPKFANNHLRVSTTPHRLVLIHTTTTDLSGKTGITDYPLSSIFAEEITAGVAVTHRLTIKAAVATQLDYRLPGINFTDRIIGSCHGILCFAKDRDVLNDQRYALLWNPSIRKFTKLPSLDKPELPDRYGIRLTKNVDLRPKYVYGFGYVYDHFNHNYSYKVVAVNSYGTGYRPVHKTQVRVHTLGTNCWRSIEDFPSGFQFDASGRFVTGTLNWLGFERDRSWVILSLDLEKESYQELVQPEYGVVTVNALTLGVARDCLCILAHTDTFADFWLMNEYGNKESWTKLFSIPDLKLETYCGFHYRQILYLSDDDQVLLECQPYLVVYNSRYGTFKVLEFQNIRSWMFTEVYQESLVLPCSQ